MTNADLRLMDQGQVREDVAKHFEFIKPDDGQIFRYADIHVLQGQLLRE